MALKFDLALKQSKKLSVHRANLSTVTEKKQETLRERLARARRRRRLPPREGHEISAGGKEVRTPSEGEFLGNLEKASDGPADALAYPRKDKNGG